MRQLIAPLAVLALVGCQKEEEEPKVDPPSPIFEDGELEPGETQLIESKDLEWAMRDEADSFAATTPDEEDDEVAKCIEGKLETLTFDADKANAELSGTIDISECDFDSDEVSLAINTSKVDYLVYLGCENEDLEDLDGLNITLAEGQLGDICKDPGESQIMANVRQALNYTLTFKGTGDEEDLSFTYDSVTYSALQTADGGACVTKFENEEWGYSDDCVDVTRVKTNSIQVNDSDPHTDIPDDFLKLAYTGIRKADDDSTWYVAGNFGVTLNNWTGSVTFNGEEDPKWEMTDGSEAVSGTFTYANLVKDAVSSMTQKLITKARRDAKDRGLLD